MGGVLRGFPPGTLQLVCLGQSPHASLPMEEILHLRIENALATNPCVLNRFRLSLKQW
jgi:hypothetical protein